jgi:cytoskeletal protein RodZ
VIGVGPALRKARERCGVTLDEASRQTRIRADFLEALEDERFDALLGEVYVRGALRSYASYLGLDPEKAVRAYAGAEGVAEPAPPEPPTQIRRAIGAARRRDNHRLAALVVLVLVSVAAGSGLLSTRNAAPTPAELPALASPRARTPATVDVSVSSLHRPVRAGVAIDGVQHPPVTVRAGESRVFRAEEFLTVRLSRGGVARVTVNGQDLGVVGTRGEPWEDSFSATSVVAPAGDPSTAAASADGAGRPGSQGSGEGAASAGASASPTA